MARVRYLNREDLPEVHRSAYDRLLRERGNPAPNIFLALANLPHILDSMISFTGDMRRGAAMQPALREICIMMVGLRTQAQYEFDHHWKSAMRAGVSREKLERLADFETDDLFSPAERAALAYAVEVTDHVAVRDATWDRLAQFFSHDEIMDLVMAIAWYNAVVRILRPLEIEVEDWFTRDIAPEAVEKPQQVEA